MHALQCAVGICLEISGIEISDLPRFTRQKFSGCLTQLVDNDALFKFKNFAAADIGIRTGTIVHGHKGLTTVQLHDRHAGITPMDSDTPGFQIFQITLAPAGIMSGAMITTLCPESD